jgi:hypothetical protein
MGSPEKKVEILKGNFSEGNLNKRDALREKGGHENKEQH